MACVEPNKLNTTSDARPIQKSSLLPHSLMSPEHLTLPNVLIVGRRLRLDFPTLIAGPTRITLDRTRHSALMSFCLRIFKASSFGSGSGSNQMESSEIRFGRFRLDLRRRTLLRDDLQVRLGGRPLDILCALASAGGDVLTQDELMARLWSGYVCRGGQPLCPCRSHCCGSISRGCLS